MSLLIPLLCNVFFILLIGLSGKIKSEKQVYKFKITGSTLIYFTWFLFFASFICCQFDYIKNAYSANNIDFEHQKIIITYLLLINTAVLVLNKYYIYKKTTFK